MKAIFPVLVVSKDKSVKCLFALDKKGKLEI